jgi:NAD-dependent SIR2 family protein deacetylase
MSNTSNAVNLSNLAELQTKESTLKELQRKVNALKNRKAWEAKTKKRNPQYVLGSLRKATPQDEAQLGHCHGQVVTIECASCGKERIVNKQDAFQCKYCMDCKVEARKAVAKAKRAEKRLEGKSVKEVEAQIEALNEELAGFGADSLANALID